jgi:hypothetical protein
MVTHSSTSRPVQCLCMAERTGCPVFTDLWSYVHNGMFIENIMAVIFDYLQNYHTPTRPTASVRRFLLGMQRYSDLHE